MLSVFVYLCSVLDDDLFFQQAEDSVFLYIIPIDAQSLSCTFQMYRTCCMASPLRWMRNIFMRITCSGNTVNRIINIYILHIEFSYSSPYFSDLSNWIYSLRYVCFFIWLWFFTFKWHLLHAQRCSTNAHHIVPFLFISFTTQVGNELECTIRNKNKPLTIWSESYVL